MTIKKCIHKALFSFYFLSSALSAVEVIENKAVLPILNPDFKEQKKLKLRLDNGLEAFIVSDPRTKESSAVLTVKMGSWDEPEDQPGLAHFLEHMLFLGTSKYPSEAEYDKFISQHKGLANAFTYNDITSYMFSIMNEGFVEALDRFSYFFKEPLFNPSGVSRELKAIDQEYQKNLMNDNFRSLQVLKDLSNPKHPFHRFDSGNENSLKNTSQAVLKEWYSQSYSADRMRLYIFSNLPIDTLKSLVIENFSDIPRVQTMEAPKAYGKIFDESIKEKKIFIEPIQDVNQLQLVWELSDEMSMDSERKPFAIACYILGNESEKSLLSTLKKEGLAYSLGCSDVRFSQNKLLFLITAELTKKGVEESDRVIEKIFQAIESVKETGVSHEFFSDIQKLKKIQYQMASRENTFSEAMEMGFTQAYEPLATFPEKTELLGAYDPVFFQKFMKELSPKEAVFMIMAPSSLTNIPYDKKQKWTETVYTVQNFDTSFLKDLKPDPAFALPEKNRFIPSELSLKGKEYASYLNLPVLKLIKDEEGGRLFFGQDLIYEEPKFFASFEIKTPYAIRSQPLNAALTDLYLKLLQENINEVSYDATVAGLKYSLDSSENGIKIILSGFDEKAGILLEEIQKRLRLPNLTEEQFLLAYDSLLRDYHNFYLESPLSQDYEMFQQTFYKFFSTRKQKAEALKKIQYDKFRLFLQNLFKKTFLDGLVYGNMSQEESKKLWEGLKAELGSQPWQGFKDQQVLVLSEKAPKYVEKATEALGNAMILAVEDADYSFKKRAAQQILALSLKNAFFEKLRTKQQTGYIVTSQSDDFQKKMFTFFMVQSATHTPHDLLYRTEQFIEEYLQELTTTLTKERFEVMKEGLAVSLQDRPKNIEEMGRLLDKIINDYEADFEWLKKRLEGLNELTYEEFIQFSKEFLGREHKQRIAFLLRSLPLENKMFRYKPSKIRDVIKDSSY